MNARHTALPGIAKFWLLFVTSFVLFQLENPTFLAGQETTTPVASTVSDQELLQFVSQHCHECHNGETSEGDVLLTRLSLPRSDSPDRKTWESVLEFVQSSAMPPEDHPQPDRKQREEFCKLLEQKLFHAECDLEPQPGRVTLRRLNRTEYDHTIRDLLGLDTHPAEQFPADEVGGGFDNNGDLLSLSPLLAEKYLDSAERLAKAAWLAPEDYLPPILAPSRRNYQLTGEAKRNEVGLIDLESGAQVDTSVTIEREGNYRFHCQVGNVKKRELPIYLSIVRKGEPPQWTPQPVTEHGDIAWSLPAPLAAGDYQISFRVDLPDATSEKRDAHLIELSLSGPLEPDANELPMLQKHWFNQTQTLWFSSLSEDVWKKELPSQLTNLARRAFRRPVSAEELAPYLQLIEQTIGKGHSRERGFQVGIQAILVSPDFLFRPEGTPPAGSKHAPLNDFELASRLSYFLWTSMPDDELLSLAETGTLHQSEVLEKQVRRMLADQRSWGLTENFAGQWLNLRMLAGFQPDTKEFPQFDDDLRSAMAQETLLLFHCALQENHSVTSLLDADFTFVNEPLAKHYGIAGIEGAEFQRVSLAGVPRAGILTHASILALTSNPTRTSPVKRGKWIMENILGIEPPEAPADAPDFSLTEKAAPHLNLRDQMKLHREDPGCASCHRMMDTIGFGFENYNLLGQYRTEDKHGPLDASGELPDGNRFSGALELIKLLKSDQKRFATTFAERMMVFALGRSLSETDHCTIEPIIAESVKENFRMQDLIIRLVKSAPFLERQSEGEQL